jgi:hypothetical protein
VAIRGEVPQVTDLDVEHTPLDRAADDAGCQRLLEHRRKNCHDIERHNIIE